MARRVGVCSIVVVTLLALVPAAAKESETALKMRQAAAAFLASLDEGQRTQATFPFEADERLNWHFVPRERKGLPLGAMTPPQREKAAAMLRAALSDKGYKKTEGIRGLETVLHELQQGKGPVRDPDSYFVTVFGAPSADRPWGWRYEGHHLSQNWTVVGGSAVASSPQFLGANPALVRTGPLTGTRVLAGEEDLARTFLASLDEGQMKDAVVSPEAPRDILTMNQRETGQIEHVGIPWTKLSGGQQKLLMRLIEEYAFNQAPAIAQARMTTLRKAGLDTIRMAWLGATAKGAKHYYRVQGPTFLIEYDNTQNDGNHIHSVWRDFKGDFGRDLLAEHYRSAHGPGHPHTHPHPHAHERTAPQQAQ